MLTAVNSWRNHARDVSLDGRRVRAAFAGLSMSLMAFATRSSDTWVTVDDLWLAKGGNYVRSYPIRGAREALRQ